MFVRNGGNKVDLKDVVFHQDPNDHRSPGTESLVSVVVSIGGEPPTPEQQQALLSALNDNLACKAAVAAAFAEALEPKKR